MKISSAILTTIFMLAAPFVGATQGDSTPAKPSVEVLRRNIEHWKSLPQTERERIRNAYRQYQALKPEQVSVVQDNFRKFRNMPAERRRELSKKLQGLPAQDRERVAQKLRELQNMGQDRRKMAIEFARLAHSLTPEQKRQLKELSSPEEKKQFGQRLMREQVLKRYLQDLSPDERAAFHSLQRPEQKRRLQKDFRDRAMRGPPK
ncbi:MAG: DUF3106 domain-containing protein [Planctomycetota bacterium]